MNKPVLTREDKLEMAAVRRFLEDKQDCINAAKEALDKLENGEIDVDTIDDLNDALIELDHEEALGELHIEQEMYDEYDNFIPQTRYYGGSL